MVEMDVRGVTISRVRVKGPLMLSGANDAYNIIRVQANPRYTCTLKFCQVCLVAMVALLDARRTVCQCWKQSDFKDVNQRCGCVMHAGSGLDHRCHYPRDVRFRIYHL